MRLIKTLKEASIHTKIFWVVALGVFILSTAMCLYPYVWLAQNRSTTIEETP